MVGNAYINQRVSKNMDNKLLIGCGLGYEPSISYNWVKSIRNVGFNGDVHLIVNDKDGDYSPHARLKCEVSRVDESDLLNNLPSFRFKKLRKIPPHVRRFYFIERALRNCKREYIITTDVRDVVFQKNPFDLLEFKIKNNKLVFSGEGIKFRDEKWGLENINQSFGEEFATTLYDTEVFNVGVIGGKWDYVINLIRQIYTFSLARPIPIVDQAVFNMLISNPIYKNITSFQNHEDDWACNLGTNLDPRIEKEYKQAQIYFPPAIKDGYIVNKYGERYSIVHQYDRCPGLKNVMTALETS